MLKEVTMPQIPNGHYPKQSYPAGGAATGSSRSQTCRAHPDTRMPVILPENQFDSWLSGEAGKEILVPYPADQMTVWSVSPRVNSPKNNDPGILEPIVGDVQVTSAPGYQVEF